MNGRQTAAAAVQGITRLPGPCWYAVLYGHHAEPYAHLPSREEAQALADELGGEGARQFRAPCWTVTCTGCGLELHDPEPARGYEPLHAPDAAKAAEAAEDQGWRTDGFTARCPACYPDVAALADAATKIAGYALAFGRIDRSVCRHPDGRPESDTDHTVGLAWFATALAAACEPSLDTGLVAQALLVHDAVEVFAGDTPTLRITAEGKAAKAVREQDAAARWRAELSDVLPWLPDMIGRYERQEEPECRFGRAADKIAPKLIHIINRCADLVDAGITVSELECILTAQRQEITTYAGEFETLLALYDEMGARVLDSLRQAEAARPTGGGASLATIPDSTSASLQTVLETPGGAL
jgi:putative hydrolases of HD superfamily